MINAINSIKSTVTGIKKLQSPKTQAFKSNELKQDTVTFSSKAISTPSFKGSMSNYVLDDISSKLLSGSNGAKKELEALSAAIRIFNEAYNEIAPGSNSAMTHQEAMQGIMGLMQKDAEVAESLFNINEQLKTFKTYVRDINKFTEDYKSLLVPEKTGQAKVLAFPNKSNPSTGTIYSDFSMLMAKSPDKQYSLEQIRAHMPKFKQYLAEFETNIYQKYHDLHSQYSSKLDILNANVEAIRKELMGH